MISSKVCTIVEKQLIAQNCAVCFQSPHEYRIDFLAFMASRILSCLNCLRPGLEYDFFHTVLSALIVALLLLSPRCHSCNFEPSHHLFDQYIFQESLQPSLLVSRSSSIRSRYMTLTGNPVWPTRVSRPRVMHCSSIAGEWQLRCGILVGEIPWLAQSDVLGWICHSLAQ